MHPIQRILINPNTAFQIVDGESVLLDIDASHYFGLNDETGTRIWQLIGEYGEFRTCSEKCARSSTWSPSVWRRTPNS